jgi:hypothetical protein
MIDLNNFLLIKQKSVIISVPSIISGSKFFLSFKKYEIFSELINENNDPLSLFLYWIILL